MILFKYISHLNGTEGEYHLLPLVSRSDNLVSMHLRQIPCPTCSSKDSLLCAASSLTGSVRTPYPSLRPIDREDPCCTASGISTQSCAHSGHPPSSVAAVSRPSPFPRTPHPSPIPKHLGLGASRGEKRTANSRDHGRFLLIRSGKQQSDTGW